MTSWKSKLWVVELRYFEDYETERCLEAGLLRLEGRVVKARMVHHLVLQTLAGSRASIDQLNNYIRVLIAKVEAGENKFIQVGFYQYNDNFGPSSEQFLEPRPGHPI